MASKRVAAGKPFELGEEETALVDGKLELKVNSVTRKWVESSEGASDSGRGFSITVTLGNDTETLYFLAASQEEKPNEHWKGYAITLISYSDSTATLRVDKE